MATIGIVLDCEDPEALAEFWAAAFGYTNVGSAGSYVLLLPPDPTQPKLLLQRGAVGVRHAVHVLADPEGNELCVCDDGQAS